MFNLKQLSVVRKIGTILLIIELLLCISIPIQIFGLIYCKIYMFIAGILGAISLLILCSYINNKILNISIGIVKGVFKALFFNMFYRILQDIVVYSDLTKKPNIRKMVAFYVSYILILTIFNLAQTFFGMIQKHVTENKNKPYVILFQAINNEVLQSYFQDNTCNNMDILKQQYDLIIIARYIDGPKVGQSKKHIVFESIPNWAAILTLRDLFTPSHIPRHAHNYQSLPQLKSHNFTGQIQS